MTATTQSLRVAHFLRSLLGVTLFLSLHGEKRRGNLCGLESQITTTMTLLRLLIVTASIITAYASSISLAPIVVKAKKAKLSDWQFVESSLGESTVNQGFEEQNLKNIPGLNTTTNGNPGQLTTISILGAASCYTKILWSGLSVNESETDAAIIPFSTGKIEVIKGIHCAEYGNGAIGGIINVVPFCMPEDQEGGAAINIGNKVRHGHFWWMKNTNGFSIQQHLVSNAFMGKNTIPRRYQDKYPTSMTPNTEKECFLNKIGFQSHHGKAALQLGLLKSNSTGNNIYLMNPFDSRSKRTLQIYAIDLEGAPENIQPQLKMLNTKIINRDFSPYQNIENAYGSVNTKVRFGIKFKKDLLTLEPLAEVHRNTLNSPEYAPKKSTQFAFAQGCHIQKDDTEWKNWARIQKANHLDSAYAFSSSLRTSHDDTEFSAHIGTGFRLPDLYMLNDVNYGNANLKGETAYGGNLGAAQKTFLGKFNLLVFQTFHRHQIDYQGGHYVNLNRSFQRGFEWGWKNTFGNWGAHLSGTYVESIKLNPRASLLNIPKISGQGKIFYDTEQISASFGWRYTGTQTQLDFENTNLQIKRGGYPVFFGDCQYRFNENTVFSVGIENMLGRNIESPLGYRGPGFQIQTGVSIKW